MKRRTTELDHYFMRLIYSKLNAFCAEGLTLDSNRDFTAVIQAIQYEDDEKVDIVNDIGEENVLANMLLASELNIPFYVIVYKKKTFFVCEIVEDKISEVVGKVKIKVLNKFSKEKEFVDWWASIKQTAQPHDMVNGARARADQTIFDSVLEKYGFEWGGNIDGFRIEDNHITCIFDDISISFTELESNWADPALFFDKKGPKYNTWYSTVKLANILNVPHILFTKNKKNENDERLGITVIEELNPTGIYYYGDMKPYNHIVKGIDAIITEVNSLIASSKKPNLK